MKRKVILMLMLLLCAVSARAQMEKGDMAAVLNWPGIGFKNFLQDHLAGEIKYQTAEDVTVTGLRGYYYFSKTPGVHIFTGIEVDTISFKGEEGDGNGTAFEVMIGAEHFIQKFNNKLSVEADFGPAVIDLKNTNANESLSGIEMILNIGVNWFFSK